MQTLRQDSWSVLQIRAVISREQTKALHARVAWGPWCWKKEKMGTVSLRWGKVTNRSFRATFEQPDFLLAQRGDVLPALSISRSMFRDSSPKSSLPVALAHSPRHLDLGCEQALLQVVCTEPVMGRVLSSRPQPLCWMASAGSALLISQLWPFQLHVLASVPISDPFCSGDPLAFLLRVIRVWLLYLGLSSALPTPTLCHFWCSLQPGVEKSLCRPRPRESHQTRIENPARERRLRQRHVVVYFLHEEGFSGFERTSLNLSLQKYVPKQTNPNLVPIDTLSSFCLTIKSEHPGVAVTDLWGMRQQRSDPNKPPGKRDQRHRIFLMSWAAKAECCFLPFRQGPLAGGQASYLAGMQAEYEFNHAEAHIRLETLSWNLNLKLLEETSR